MKFVHISDTHTMHDRIVVPEGDCLIVSGDFLGAGNYRELIDFNTWLGTLPHKYKIVVAGNHDRIFEKDPAFAKKLLTNATHYLQDSEVTIEGIRIYGAPWQPEFCNWAFNLPRGPALKAKWDLIPVGIDILITHGPPAGILDYFPQFGGMNAVGCEELREAVLRVLPAYHLFGHIHYAHGKLEYMGVTFLNSAICTEAYSPIQAPQVFEFTKQ